MISPFPRSLPFVLLCCLPAVSLLSPCCLPAVSPLSLSNSAVLLSVRRCALLHLQPHPVVLSHSLRVQIRQSPSSLSLSVSACLSLSVWRVMFGNHVVSRRSLILSNGQMVASDPV